MFVVTVDFNVTPDYTDSFREAVGEQASHSLREEGCKQFDVCFDEQDPTRVFLYEVYTDRDAFQSHKETPHFKKFGDTTRAWVEKKIVRTWQRA
jgi:quinol monooxygenase YgiN